MHEYKYKKTKLFDANDLVDLFTSVGWVEKSAKYPTRLESIICSSSAVFSA